jgi:hypothetical protein
VLTISTIMSGCGSDTEVVFIALPDTTPYAKSFLIELDQRGGVARVLETNPSSVERAPLSPETRYLFVGVAEAALRQVAFDLDEQRMNETDLRTVSTPETCGPSGVLDASNSIRRVPIPAESALLTWSGRTADGFEPANRREFPVLGGLSMSVPILEDPCPLEDESQLTAFADQADLFSSPMGTAVLRVDETRAVVATLKEVRVVLRGQPLPQTPESLVDLGAAIAPSSIRDVKVAADRSAGEEPLRIVVAARLLGDTGAIFELQLRGRALSLHGSARVGSYFRDLVIDEQGRLIAVGSDGTVITRTSSSATHQVHTLPTRPEGVLVTGFDEPLHVISTREGVLHFGDAFRQSWDSITVETSELSPDRHEGLTLRRGPEGTELWLGGSDGSLVSALLPALSGFEGALIRAPRALSDCATAPNECGERALNNEIKELLGSGIDSGEAERMIVVPSDCSAILSLRPKDRCSSVLIPEGVGVTHDAAMEVLSISAWENWLTLVNRAGQVFEVRHNR